MREIKRKRWDLLPGLDATQCWKMGIQGIPVLVWNLILGLKPPALQSVVWPTTTAGQKDHWPGREILEPIRVRGRLAGARN